MTPRRRLAWFAAAVFVVLFGLGEFGSWVVAAWQGHSWWGIDLHLILDAGARLTAGQPIYADPRFLYPPLAAVVGAPLAPLDFDAVSLVYAAAKVAIAAACVWSVGSGWTTLARVLVLITLVCSLPFLHDVMLGNVNVLLVGAMVPAMLASPRPRHGILLGLVIAAFAKPLVVPILLWLLVWRRPVFGVTVLTGLIATAVGALDRRARQLPRLAARPVGRHQVRLALRRQPRRDRPVPGPVAADRGRRRGRSGRRAAPTRPGDRHRLGGGIGDPHRAVCRHVLGAAIALALPGMSTFLPTLALLSWPYRRSRRPIRCRLRGRGPDRGALRYRETRRASARTGAVAAMGPSAAS